MASRAEDRTAHLRARPERLGSAVRAAFSDYYFNSIRLVAANVAWGAGIVAVAFVGLVWPLGGLLLLPLLALPTAAIFRVAAIVVRAEPTARGDLAWPYRHAAVRTIGLGAGVAAIGVILATNILTGLGGGMPIGLVLATLAGWGLVALWVGALVAWPLVVDPARDGTPLGARLRLAAALLLVDPIRFGGLGLVVAVIVAISTVLTAAILTVSVSFVAVLACRMVYPVADRLRPPSAGGRP